MLTNRAKRLFERMRCQMKSIESVNFPMGMAEHFKGEVSRLSRHWGWYLAAGIALIALGIFALGESALTTLMTVTFLGWMVTIAGIVALVHSFSYFKEGFGHFLGHFLAGALYFVLGTLMIGSPGITALTVTLMIAPLFMVSGIVRIMSAIILRSPQWGWQCFSGVLTAVLGMMIWAQWPVSGFWLVGTYVGIEILMYGWSVSLFALALKRIHAVSAAA